MESYKTIEYQKKISNRNNVIAKLNLNYWYLNSIISKILKNWKQRKVIILHLL